MSNADRPLAGKHGLVLDDEFLIALDLQEILEAAGAQITCVSSVDHGLKELQGGNTFDFAVLDMHLGGGVANGLIVATELMRRRIPFTFISGIRGDDQLTRQFPGVPLIEKPYHPSALLAMIAKLLA